MGVGLFFFFFKEFVILLCKEKLGWVCHWDVA